MLGLLGRFGLASGWPALAECLLDYDLIEGFCVRGCAGAASSTRGTYRSVLYALARPVNGRPSRRPAPFPGAKPPPPYSPAERAELAAVAGAQRDAVKRSSALALVVFGIGAGLRPGELVALRGTDVTRRGRQVVVSVSGPTARVVPVTARLRRPRLGAGPARGQRFRVPARPGPTAATRTSSAASPGAWPLTRPRPRLSLRRARSTFICGHLAAGTPVPVLLAVTGIAGAGSLARYARHVAGISSSKGALRARCRAERTR